MPYKNKQDRSAYHKQYYALNRQDYLRRNRERRQANAIYVQNYKATNPCTDCGLFYPFYVMDFDHLGDKSGTIAHMMGESLTRILAEIAKCELVCSNCHRQRTYTRQKST